MFETETQDFEVRRGGTFDPTLTIKSFNLTGWDVELTVGSGASKLTLSVGNGLTINPPVAPSLDSTIDVEMTPAQTSRYSRDQHYVLRFISPAGKVGFPISGTMSFVDP